jgi:RNA polymerase sigma-70 factor (ECF subfamily)
VNQWRRGQARKREGAHVHVPLDTTFAESRFAAEAQSNTNPEKLYDRDWAWTLLDRVLARLRAEQVARGKGKLFEALKPALMGDPPASSYTRMAREFGTTEMALSMAVHRLRRRFRKMLREEIAPMVHSPEEIDDEISYLFRALG